MNLPYYYTESPLNLANESIFSVVKEKLANLQNSFQKTYDSPLLKEFETSSIHQIQHKTPILTRKSLENCLKYPEFREFRSKFTKNDDKFVGFLDENPEKNGEISQKNADFLKEKCNVDAKGDFLMNHLKLNEFLFKKDVDSSVFCDELTPNYSNIKEYKHSQTRNSGDLLNKSQEKPKNQMNFRTPDKKSMNYRSNCEENEKFLKEFPLDQLKISLSSSKKKKGIFDIFSEKSKNSFKKVSISKNNEENRENQDFMKKSLEKNKGIYKPNCEEFEKKYRILDKNGEDLTGNLLKFALLDDTAILFENLEVKIGMKSFLAENLENSMKKNGLMVFLYYCNKNRGDLRNCCLIFEHSKSFLIFFDFY